VFGICVITLIYTINGKTIDRKIKYFFPKFLFFAIQQNSVFTLFDKISQQPENWENRNGPVSQ
jgi:hypothetical protein